MNKYELILSQIVQIDFDGNLDGVKTEDAYEKYLFYCNATGIKQVENKQRVMRDICTQYNYLSKQKMKDGNRFYVFEKKVTK